MVNVGVAASASVSSVSSSAPVGVVFSPSAPSEKMARPSSRRAVAGAGTGKRPCSVFTVPPPTFTNTSFLEHIFISTARVFGAFLLACLIGLPLGLAMGMSPLIRGIFDPPIEFYRPIPPLAYLPLMIIWFGIGETSKVLLIFLSVFAPVVLGARSGVKSAAIEQIHAAYSFGATRWQVMRHVILPSAMPEILTAMRVGIGFGWTTLVAAEMVAATSGLGYMVLSASQFLQTSVVIMGIFVIATIAFAFDLLMRFLERRLVPWKGRM